ncbi:thioredoxin family protein [Utexia brackfieldae]|uniref:thioredoxin family protein n=1 Tax=Utexia brackfieldae TaxID=3074108 RepID=UPI00370D95EF
MSKTVLVVTAEQLASQLLSTERLILLFCINNSSDDYQTMLPMIETLQSHYQSQIYCCQIDIDQDTAFAKKMAIDVVPTIFLIRHQQIIDEREGRLTADELAHFIENNL